MIWWLLTLYPAIGLGVGIYYNAKLRSVGIEDKLGSTLALMAFVWPVGIYICRKDIANSLDKPDSEMEQLLESVRQERLAPDPRLAEFDILLGIEPEPKIEYAFNTVEEWREWKKTVNKPGSPPQVTQGYAYGLEPELNFFVDDTRLCDAPEFRVKDQREPFAWETTMGTDEWDLRGVELTKAYSRLAFSAGGYIPTTTELKPDVDTQAKVD